VLGQDAPLDQLAPKIALAARHPICRGFAVGRSIFGDAAKAWFAGRIDEAAVVEQIASRYGALVELLFDSSAEASTREVALSGPLHQPAQLNSAH